jgi:hypothetical protein
MNVQADEVQEGYFLTDLDNGYVVEVEEGGGYLSYPQTSYGQSVAMPDDTVVITFHDANGNENYLLLHPEHPLNVKRDEQ